MTIIHMNTDEVNSCIQKFRGTICEFDDQIKLIKQSCTRLGSAWSGNAASVEFIRSFEGNILHLTAAFQALEIMERQISFELQEWQEVDAFFTKASSGSEGIPPSGGDVPNTPLLTTAEIRGLVCGVLSGAEKTRCEVIWSNPPTNAEQLAYMIMNLPDSLPIVIMQIGDGQYLVLIRGTTAGADEGSNWGSAFEAMFGNSSYQNSVIDAINNANLPPGATLNFAGHSQGGMVAQNLAVDPRILGNYNVDSVCMFGSPDTIAPANPNVHYVSFEAPGDVVTHLDEVVRGLIPGPIDGMFNDVSRIAEHHTITNTVDAYNPNPWVSHAVYDNPGVLNGIKLPFTTDNWQPISMSESEISTIGADAYKGVIETADAVVQRIKELGLM